jgi:hypothetical protein
MTWSPDSSTTGGAQTGFTSPTFTLVSDQAPTVNAKQYAVTTIGGTGFTASANSISKPFTATFSKPLVPRGLPSANPLTGLRGSVPNNQYKLVIRKGGLAAADVPCTLIIRLTIDIPAGMDSYNPDEVRAALSFLVGLLNEESGDLGDTCIQGVL